METTFDRERPEIEECSTYISIDPSCTQEIENSNKEHLHDMRMEGQYQVYIKKLVPRGNEATIPFLPSKPSDPETSNWVGAPYSGNHSNNLLICR